MSRYREMETMEAGAREAGPWDVRERIEKREREKKMRGEEGRDEGQGWRFEE